MHVYKQVCVLYRTLTRTQRLYGRTHTVTNYSHTHTRHSHNIHTETRKRTLSLTLSLSLARAHTHGQACAHARTWVPYAAPRARTHTLVRYAESIVWLVAARKRTRSAGATVPWATRDGRAERFTIRYRSACCVRRRGRNSSAHQVAFHRPPNGRVYENLNQAPRPCLYKRKYPAIFYVS